MPTGPFERRPRFSPADPVDSRGWNIGEGPADMRRLQAQTVEQRPGNRAFRAVGELVECSTVAKMRERTLQDGVHFAQRHR